ncbi:MAG: permease-like cell division protein FtsX [Oscillospiraceae bacterium]|nr:permease-like cell division protein FtsX [Oscillospiraceae bacterium]
MKGNNFGYLIKEGIRGIFLHGFMSFAAVFVTVACLLIVGTFFSVIYNIGLKVEELNEKNEILVFVDETFSDAEAKSVGSDLALVKNVEQAIFIPREEAYEDFREDMGQSGAFDGLSTQTFRHRFRILPTDPQLLEETKAALLEVEGVVKVKVADDVVNLLTTIQNVVSMFSIVVIVALVFVSLLIISNTVKLAMADRRDEIAIMKMVGATNGFIRLPFVVQGFLLGILGSGIAFGAEWLLYNFMANQLVQMDGGLLLTMVPFTQLILPMLVIFAGTGMFVGVVGSFASIRRFLKV